MTAIPWYEFPTVNNYGSYPDPYGNFPKPDININAPNGTPITALESGVISGINSPAGTSPDFGQVVTVTLTNPINSLATHIAYLHLGSLATGLAVGQPVTPGEVLGYAGPNPQGNAGTGLALYPGDYYGYGPAWSNVGSPLLNPTSLLNSFLGGPPVSTTTPGATTTPTGTPLGATSLFTFPNLWQWLGVQQPAATVGAIDWQDIGIRSGLVLVGIIILIIAIAHMLERPSVVVEEK
jgi:Peptidase family M23